MKREEIRLRARLKRAEKLLKRVLIYKGPSCASPGIPGTFSGLIGQIQEFLGVDRPSSEGG